MSETKFTPGPWWYKRALTPSDGEYDFGVLAVFDGVRRCIAETFGRASENVRPNAEANAALIAAAPDLYALLQELIDIEGPQPGTAMWADKVFAALRKARGEPDDR